MRRDTWFLAGPMAFVLVALLSGSEGCGGDTTVLQLPAPPAPSRSTPRITEPTGLLDAEAPSLMSLPCPMGDAGTLDGFPACRPAPNSQCVSPTAMISFRSVNASCDAATPCLYEFAATECSSGLRCAPTGTGGSCPMVISR